MRAIRRVFVVGALSALVVALVPSAGAQTPTVTSVIGSADGLFAELDVDVIGPEEEGVGALQDISFGPAPTVTLPSDGGSVSEQILSVDESFGPVSLTAGLLTAAAEGALGPQGFATAETTVADLALFEEILLPIELSEGEDVGAQQLEDPVIGAEAITATCAADLTGVSGSTTLVGATVLGETLAVEPPPNTEFTISLDSIATVGVTLNRQVQNPDGALSVTALVLEVDILDIATGTLQVGPATCGVVEGVEPAPAPAPAPAQAVPAQVRFTG